MRVYLIFALLICLVVGCDMTSGQRFTEDYVVIAALICAGEQISQENPVYISKTLDIDKIELADILIFFDRVYIEETETGEFVDLEPFWKEIRIAYWDPTASFTIEEGKTYRLVAKIGADSTWAETTVSMGFELAMEHNGYTDDIGEIEAHTMEHRFIDDDFPLQIRVNERKDTVVSVEFYCLEEFSPDLDITMDDYFGGLEITIETEEDYESFMSGSPRRNRFLDKYMPDADCVVTVGFTEFNYLFYGRYRTSVHVVDDNYYKYRYKNQGYFHGGVHNGIGYFGSASKKVLYTKVVK